MEKKTVQNLHEHLGKMSENGTLDLHFTCLNVFDWNEKRNIKNGFLRKKDPTC